MPSSSGEQQCHVMRLSSRVPPYSIRALDRRERVYKSLVWSLQSISSRWSSDLHDSIPSNMAARYDFKPQERLMQSLLTQAIHALENIELAREDLMAAMAGMRSNLSFKNITPGLEEKPTILQKSGSIDIRTIKLSAVHHYEEFHRIERCAQLLKSCSEAACEVKLTIRKMPDELEETSDSPLLLIVWRRFIMAEILLKGACDCLVTTLQTRHRMIEPLRLVHPMIFFYNNSLQIRNQDLVDRFTSQPMNT